MVTPAQYTVGDCYICIHPLNSTESTLASDEVAFGCKHVLHSACARNALLQGDGRCGVCRTPISLSLKDQVKVSWLKGVEYAPAFLVLPAMWALSLIPPATNSFYLVPTIQLVAIALFSKSLFSKSNIPMPEAGSVVPMLNQIGLLSFMYMLGETFLKYGTVQCISYAAANPDKQAASFGWAIVGSLYSTLALGTSAAALSFTAGRLTPMRYVCGAAAATYTVAQAALSSGWSAGRSLLGRVGVLN